jgi:hypothetical protein
MTKRSLSLLLAVCLTLSLGVSAAAADTFSDVKAGSWYYDNVTRMVELGAINGYGDGTFRPGGSITNGEFLAILMRMLSDTKDYPATGSHWASGVLRAAYDTRVCAQSDLTAEDLDTPITRARAAKYTANAVRLLQKEAAPDTAHISALIGDFAAVEASGCATEVLRMYAAGILTGDTAGNFNPDSDITRSEAATVILRAYDPKIRVLSFGIDDSFESAKEDSGVFFFYVAGTKYNVKSVDVLSAQANGVSLIITPGNTHQAYQDLINSSSRAQSTYGAISPPDAFVRFKWDGDAILALADEHVTAEGGTVCPVVDFTFTLDITLSDGTVLPYTYSVSYYFQNYYGVL